MTALELIGSGDARLFQIVGLSLFVTLSATLLAAGAGMPLGALLALSRFPGATLRARQRRDGPATGGGRARRLFAAVALRTPGRVWHSVHAASDDHRPGILISPIIAALTRQVIEDLWAEYKDELTAMHVAGAQRVATLLWDARFSLITTLLAGFGRAAAEVGAVMIVGGNIDGFTRVMTTTIALETSKGNLPLAIGLGFVLIAVILIVNALAWAARGWSERHAG